jgi:hypothetical protein
MKYSVWKQRAQENIWPQRDDVSWERRHLYSAPTVVKTMKYMRLDGFQMREG